MHLTKKEEKILEGKEGDVCQKAMEILVALGDIYDADKLIKINSVQVAGVSYKTIGDAGIEFLKDMKGQKVKVPTQLNPAGMDLEKWQEHGVTKEFASKQKEIIDIFREMDIDTKCTCTPYLTGLPHGYGQHLAWSESSAVSYVNSVIGARTNREGGPSALSSALIGKTPNYGYHLKENRKPDITIKVDTVLEGSDYGALGRIIGREVGNKVPYYQLESKPKDDELKGLGAAMASTGAVALYHVEGVTPESNEYTPPQNTLTITEREINQEYRGSKENVDLVAIGCPHLSPSQLETIKNLLEDRKTKKETWLFVSREVRDKMRKTIDEITKSGAKIITDTCMVVSPLEEIGFKKVMVDSGKAATYLPSMCNVEVTYSNLKECIEVACSED
ncbi:aconitase X catalytic domain-containing protein [Methanonatronarchaeum sp. AMET-Sl]|uniref:aconitase X catalytic domain-containing protein n=1 Tax=Methanonatronarchaeum sp. AMET-Sl TaxID=3037654 RepID=UPI00244DDA6A|nr:aconitase X catalytic domain-containing protein [Methanonatronarchaeum sp. AMET-Sl]WGI17016.1 aconitase X catalytic domain-containing protein [Methanonatronarchaeum sp. AMET-Sl]